MKIHRLQKTLCSLLAGFLITGNFPMLMLTCHAEKTAGTNHIPMSEYYSTVTFLEYNGKGKFKGVVDAGVFVDQKSLPEDLKSSYDLSPIWQEGADPINLIKHNNTGYFDAHQSMELYSYVNNRCLDQVKDLKRGQNISWDESFVLKEFVDILPQQLDFSMSAKSVYSNAYGDLILVTASAKPFVVTMVSSAGEVTEAPMHSGIEVMTVFNGDLSDVLMSATIFQTQATVEGVAESMALKNVTIKLDPRNRRAIGFSDIKSEIDSTFAGLSNLSSSVAVSNENDLSKLPMWAGQASLVGNIATTAANVASEGSSNPVFVLGSSMIATNNLLVESGLSLGDAVQEEKNSLKGIYWLLGGAALAYSAEAGGLIKGLGSFSLKGWATNPMSTIQAARVLKVGNNFKSVFSLSDDLYQVANRIISQPSVTGLSSSQGGSSSTSSATSSTPSSATSPTAAGTTTAAGTSTAAFSIGTWGWVGIGVLGAGATAAAVGGGGGDEKLPDSPPSSSSGGFTDAVVGKKNVTFRVWDHSSEDGDRIRIAVNGKVIVEDHSLTNAGDVFAVELKSKQWNKVEVTALNTGSAPPNTGAITISDVVRGSSNQSWSAQTGEVITLWVGVE